LRYVVYDTYNTPPKSPSNSLLWNINQLFSHAPNASAFLTGLILRA
jgi:hypothetical protein